MAATIARTLWCRMFHCTNGIKHLQLCSPTLPKGQNCAVLRDVYRSAWYRSFFQSDQKTLDQNSKDEAESEIVVTKPKRPPNVFLLYMRAAQDEIKQINPDITRRQIVREAAKRWKELDPEEKAKIALERKDLYEKYKLDQIHYLENITPAQINIEEMQKKKAAMKKSKKAKKHLGMPKRPWSSYQWFLSEKFNERADESVQIFFKHAKDAWLQMSEKEKEVYYQKHKESRQQYLNEMADWEEGMIEEGRFDVIRKSTLSKLKHADGRKVESKKRNKVIDNDVRI